jgi:multicomponent Na+:H+ antiporter subunit B
LKFFSVILLFVCGGLLIFVASDFPGWADPTAPACTRVSCDYIEKALVETCVPNLVTAILADYRGYDTLFETTVIFAAGMATFFLLRNFRRKVPEARVYRHNPTDLVFTIERGGKTPRESGEFERIDSLWTPQDLIILTASRLIIPFIQIFGLYVIAHGHHSPGGGFQGGVILGASVILFAVSKNLRSAIHRMDEKTSALLCVSGVLLYVGTGFLCLIFGGNFLDYSALAEIFGVDSAMARSHGILIVEIGVGVAVMAVMVCLYYIISSAGNLDEGL